MRPLVDAAVATAFRPLVSQPPGIGRGPTLTIVIAMVLFFAALSGLLGKARDLRDAFEPVKPWRYREVGVDLSALVQFTAWYVILAYVVLSVVSAFDPRVRSAIDLGALYYVALGLLGLTLAITDSRRAIAVGRLATTLGVLVVVIDGIVGVFGRPIGAQLTLLVVVMIAAIAVRRDTRRTASTAADLSTRYPVVPIAIGLLVLLAAGLYLFRLGDFHLYDDEYFAFDTAAGLLRTGDLYQWDWVAMAPGEGYYPRAWPHTLLVAASFVTFGVSEWSARLVSAVFGVLTVPTTYLVVRYFTGRTAVALGTALALVLYPNVLAYFRWTRMYALLVPLFMVITYLVCRVLTEEKATDVGIGPLDRVTDRYLNFNVGLGLLTLPVLLLAFEIHRNAFLIVPVGFAFVLLKAVTSRERRYVAASLLGVAGTSALAVLAASTPYLRDVVTLLSFFERRNYEYVSYLLQFPFEVRFGGLLFLAGALMTSRVEDRRLRDRLTFLYVLCLFALVFYVFVGDRYVAFVYVLHVVPFVIALTLFAYVKFADAVDVFGVEALLGVLLVASMLHSGFGGTLRHDNPYGSTYGALYADDPVDFTEAYGTIERDFDPDQDVVIGFAIRDYYLRDLPRDAVVVDTAVEERSLRYRLAEAIERRGSGWVTWPTSKAHHIDPELRAAIEANFVKHHGRGVDDTNVEVFYFNESMVRNSSLAQPVANGPPSPTRSATVEGSHRRGGGGR